MDALPSLFDLTRMLGVALGIGFIIFVHELGHFLAARWCGVRVEVFSIGFGPALFSWRRGSTVYKLGAIPLGGYVKMAGDDALGAETDPEPDQLPAKSVGQRFFIYSGGVLMNLAFAVVVFPILFAVGVPFLRPVVGEVIPGGPAWHARLPEGAPILSVNGNDVFDFWHIPTEVALGDEESTELVLLDPETQTRRRVELTPVYRESPGIYSIDMLPGVHPDRLLSVEEGSPAWNAGLRSGDRVLGVSDSVPGLSLSEALRVEMNAGGPLALEVEGEEGRRVARIEPELVTEGMPPRLGIQPPFNHVVGVRSSELTRALGLREDDRLISVDGRPILRRGDLQRALAEGQGARRFSFVRDGVEETRETPPIDRGQALALASDLALMSDVESTVVLIEPGSPAERAGLRDGDRITSVDDYATEDWADVRELVGAAGRDQRALELTASRQSPQGQTEVLETVAEPEVLPIAEYGLVFEYDSYVYRERSPLAALRVGVTCSWKLVQDSWFTLKGILKGSVSGENVGGIITIGAVSYRWAESGLAKLLFFLCVLSVNVAFINVLPIPLLDGGHLFFLIVEKIKGSPVSERVLGYSQLVGLVLLLSLMVYVTFNDIARWFFE